MASNAPIIALLSIKPKYADAILSGEKRVEFRKRPFKRAVSHIVIYASSPVQRIIGWFSTKSFDEMSPNALWKRFASVGGIEQEDFETYFGSSKSGVAIHVERPKRLVKPLLLNRVHEGPPPQSFAYLSSNILEKLAVVSAHPPKRHVARKGSGKKLVSAQKSPRRPRKAT